MITAVRAAVSVLLLAGFYVVALLQLAAACALVVWLFTITNGLVAVKVAIPLFAAIVGGAGVAIWRAMRAKPEPPDGLPVLPDQAPALWAMVHELAREARTRPPGEIRLVPDVNAGVVEHARLLGLVGGRRFLFIGLPLIQVFTVDQLRSVLAHELGHYSGHHTRLSAVAYRGRLAIAGTVSRIGPYNVSGWIFKAYARLYLLVDNAVTRRQEYEADQASVRVAGRAVATSALRELPVLDAALGFYLTHYVRPGWEVGYAPDDLFGGFAHLVAARQDELAKLRNQEPEREGSRWDTHPPLADRIAAIAAAPEGQVRHDTRPATALIPHVGLAGRALQETMVDIGGRTVLPWERFTDAMLTAQSQRSADRIFRTIARQIQAEQLHLGTVFDLVAAGRVGEIAEPFFPNATRREAGPLFADVVEVLLELAVRRSGAAVWRHSWSGPAELVAVTGAPLPLAEIAKLAVSPESQPEARRRLAELHIDVTTAALVAHSDDAVGARIIAALANIKVETQNTKPEYDLLVLTKGLVFVANPGKSDNGRVRLEQIVQSNSATELAQRNWFLPYEEIAATEVLRDTPARVGIRLHNGQQLTLQERWGSELITKDSREVLLDVLRQVSEQ
jgi:Zn-dependent protease with chaperone function